MATGQDRRERGELLFAKLGPSVGQIKLKQSRDDDDMKDVNYDTIWRQYVRRAVATGAGCMKVGTLQN